MELVLKDSAARRQLRTPEAFVEFPIADCHQPIHQRFERQAVARAAAPAVRLVDRDVSYAELNAAANRAARMLLAQVGSDSRPIALMMDQSYESVVWILAILKAGLCYAPLDSRLPESALNAQVENLRPGALIGAAHHQAVCRNIAASRFAVISADASWDRFPCENLHRPVTADSVAYIFYTSGSTGMPKGVADCHRNILHNILRYTNSLKFSGGDILSLVQNPSFSGTVSSLFGALLNGATIAPFDLQGEGLGALSEWVRRAQVTVFHAVPSIFRQLSDPVGRFPDIRLVRLEGDRASSGDIAHFAANFQDHCTLVNGLGATECGLVRQFFIGKDSSLDAVESVPVGYPVPDMGLRIVDSQGVELPPGSPGEIVVESQFLATGYWGSPVRSAERFETVDEDLRRYRTGDLGRTDEDGCLTHLGRVDQRIRIAGEFVETAGIEGFLLDVPGISQGVVRDFVDQSGERRLCAYVVADPGLTVDRLRQALSERVAQHIIPTAFVFLDALPLTKDFKVDYQKLRHPGRQRPALPNDFVAPQNELERQLARIWTEVLEIDPIGVTDSFFDLGGDSLRAAQVVNRLRGKHGCAIEVSSLFEHMTIRTLANALAGRQSLPIDGPRASSENGASGLPDHNIAVIGMAGRFPGAETLDQFWSNLRAGRESITFLKPGELEERVVAEHGRETIAARGLLFDTDQFDASLFRLTPRQAQMLDPQQRLWLECVHQAMEDAGQPLGEPGYVGGALRIGVFAGAGESTYLLHLLGGNRAAVDALLRRSSDEAIQLRMGNDHDSIAMRTSFLMGFTGPSINVQTACSTSLVAVALACQALVSRQCDVSIAGGVSLTFPQRRSYRYQEGGIQSRDGHCRAFDASATGTVFGDGVGAVVLKRLEDAMADGDRIDAIIRGWAINNDGSNKASFAAPSVNGQTEVIIRAQDHAEVGPREVGYIEAHGTGTPVGDPIEFAALQRAFRRGTNACGFCGLGSVKTNVGHLDTAAGIAGLIKTILALKHREIPPTVNFRTPNPEIDLAASPFYIADRLRSWKIESGYRVAGVSSLGVGGTNCHIVLQEAVPPIERLEPRAVPAYLLTLSAASEAALDALEISYERFLSEESGHDIASIAATTQRSRSYYAYRSAIIGDSAEQIREGLSRGHESGAAPGRWRGRARRAGDLGIGFLFCGQGSQYVDMGRQLYQTHPEFRRSLQLCDHILRGQLERPLLDVMFAGAGEPGWVHRTEYAQPALFALEYSLAELLLAWGIKPRLVTGHSIGEYAAACIAGVFSLEDGIALAAARGRLMQHLPGNGTMLAATGRQGAIQQLLRKLPSELSIAAINSQTQIVVSGDCAAVDQLKSALHSQGIYYRELNVSHAFHSPQMIPALQPLEALAAQVNLRRPALRLISGLHGREVTTEVTDARYWSAQARQPVQFATAIGAMIEAGCEVFVEIGPDGVLSDFVHEVDSQRHTETVPTLRRGKNDWITLLETVGRLYARGAHVNWAAFQNGQKLRPLRLPTYPFQRSRHWYQGALVESEPASERPSGITSGHPLLGKRLRLPGSPEIRFEVRFSQTAPNFIEDHRLFGISLPPGASHFAMLAQAAECLSDDGSTSVDAVVFQDLFLLRPLLLPDGYQRDVQLIFRPAPQGWSLELASAEASNESGGSQEWTSHMTGWVPATDRLSVITQEFDLTAVKARCDKQVSSKDFYSRIWANQDGTGSAFRWIESIWQGDREALCRAICPTGIVDASDYRLHPGLIEAACQVLHCAETIETHETLTQTGATYVPFVVDAFTLFDVKSTHEDAWCHARLRDLSEGNIVGDLTILNAAGQVVAKLEGFRLRMIAREAVAAISTPTRSRDRTLATNHRPGHASGPDQTAPTHDAMACYLQRQCAALSGYPESAIALDKGFVELGLDSLAAMGLSNYIRRDFGRAVNVVQILVSKSIDSLAREICKVQPK